MGETIKELVIRLRFYGWNGSQAAEIAHLKAALECRYGLEDQLAEIRQTMTLVHYWVKEYSDDSENATHTKRVDVLTADAKEDSDG